MRRALSRILMAVWAGVLGTLCTAKASPQDLIPIYVEGAIENPPYNSERTLASLGLSEMEQTLMKSEIRCAACRYWNGHGMPHDEVANAPCPESELFACSPLDTFPPKRKPWVASGSFTRPHSNQKAILYYDDEGHDGIVVFEADRVVAHVVYAAYAGTHGDRRPLALPDIDGSGRSPILIISGGTHQGETLSGISIIGLSEKGLGNVGDAQTLDDPCLYRFGRDESPKHHATAYELFARIGPPPVFYRQAFTAICRSDEEPTNWVKSGTLEQITLDGARRTDRYVRLK